MLVMLLVVVVTAMLMSPANDNNNDKYVKFSGSHAELTDNFFQWPIMIMSIAEFLSKQR